MQTQPPEKQYTPPTHDKKPTSPIFVLAIFIAFISLISMMFMYEGKQAIEDDLTQLKFALNEATELNAVYKTKLEYQGKLWTTENNHLATNLDKCEARTESVAYMQQEVFETRMDYLRLDKKMEICEVRLEGNLQELKKLAALADI